VSQYKETDLGIVIILRTPNIPSEQSNMIGQIRMSQSCPSMDNGLAHIIPDRRLASSFVVF
jgi:hypothetical protein